MKLALLVRTDLDMGRGKIAAQVAHAAVLAALRHQGTPSYAEWMRDGQPKVVLKVRSGEQLQDLRAAAEAARLPVVVVDDAGRTQVAPGTVTCCAIGPADDEAVDRVTGALPLL